MLVRFYDDYFPHLTFLFGSFSSILLGLKSRDEMKCVPEKGQKQQRKEISFQSGISYVDSDDNDDFACCMNAQWISSEWNSKPFGDTSFPLKSLDDSY